MMLEQSFDLLTWLATEVLKPRFNPCQTCKAVLPMCLILDAVSLLSKSYPTHTHTHILMHECALNLKHMMSLCALLASASFFLCF